MKIAVPLAGGRLSSHFGHCDCFAVFRVDPETRQVVAKDLAQPPMHEPGALPRWLSDNDVEVVLAGGMGRRAQQLFAESGIQVVVGAAEPEPERLVEDYLNDRLEAGDNLCDH